jgi:hypothetical protein
MVAKGNGAADVINSNSDAGMKNTRNLFGSGSLSYALYSLLITFQFFQSFKQESKEALKLACR